jgi:hypothetical protein
MTRLRKVKQSADFPALDCRCQQCATSFTSKLPQLLGYRSPGSFSPVPVAGSTLDQLNLWRKETSDARCTPRLLAWKPPSGRDHWAGPFAGVCLEAEKCGWGGNDCSSSRAQRIASRPGGLNFLCEPQGSELGTQHYPRTRLENRKAARSRQISSKLLKVNGCRKTRRIGLITLKPAPSRISMKGPLEIPPPGSVLG